MQMKNKRHPYYALRIIMCQSNSPKLPMAVDMSVIFPVSLLSQPRSKMDAPGTSSTVWLTKAVDISVSCPVHVVVYTVPTCPADAS